MNYIKVTSVIFIALFLLSGPKAVSQEKRYRLDIITSGIIPNQDLIDDLNSSVEGDSIGLIQELSNLRDRFYSQGYLAAGFSKPEVSDSILSVEFVPGLQYRWGKISFAENKPPGVANIPRSLRVKAGKPLTIEQSENIRHSLLQLYENSGYPFASVVYDSLDMNNGVFNSVLQVNPGPLVLIDSIINRSEAIVSRKVLEQIIGLKTGQVYSEKRLIRADNQLKNSQILQQVSPLEVGFTDEKAWVFVGAKKRMANSFDGIVGLIPGASNAAGFSLTGSLDLQLNNMLKQAETLKLRWKAPGKQDQRLIAGLDIPYLLGWPVGISSSLELFKKDTSYLNTDWSLGLMAVLQANNRMGFYYREKASNVLSRKPIQGISDVKSNIYGLNWMFEKLENPLNPVRGISIKTDIGVGNKHVENESATDEKMTYWEGSGDAGLYLNIAGLWVLHFGARGGYMHGGDIYENEKFKIGGINSMRGFDEESILADAFILGTTEIRYLFSKNSNFHLFADGGAWWSELSGTQKKGLPLGFGLGVSLETRAGVILLDYALGIAEETPFSIRNGKIHLGIKSLF